MVAVYNEFHSFTYSLDVNTSANGTGVQLVYINRDVFVPKKIASKI